MSETPEPITKKAAGLTAEEDRSYRGAFFGDCLQEWDRMAKAEEAKILRRLEVIFSKNAAGLTAEERLTEAEMNLGNVREAIREVGYEPPLYATALRRAWKACVRAHNEVTWARSDVALVAIEKRAEAFQAEEAKRQGRILAEEIDRRCFQAFPQMRASGGACRLLKDTASHAGVDWAIAPDKSIPIARGVGGDDRIVSAHTAAVQIAFLTLESA